MESVIQIGTLVPNFTLPDGEGRPVRRSAYRGRKHLLLAFLPSTSDDGARAYLRALAGGYAEIRSAGSEVLAIAREDSATARIAREDLELPYPLLVDPDGATTARFIPAQARAGVFVIDRFAKLYYATVGDTTALAPIAELQSWLEAIDNQCVL